MSPEQWLALAVAMASVLASFVGILSEVRKTHQLVNSRMDELLRITRTSSFAQGKLEGPSDGPPASQGR